MAMEVEVDLVAKQMTEVTSVEEEEVIVVEELKGMEVVKNSNRDLESLMHYLEHLAH